MSHKDHDVGKTGSKSKTKNKPMAHFAHDHVPFLDLSQSSSSSSPAPGFKEKYTLGRLMGKGGYGTTVHMCTERETGNTFATKIIPKEHMPETDSGNLIRESHIMHRLPTHPNIVTLRDTFEETEEFYLVMDLCAGGQLLERLNQKTHYADREAARAMRDIAQGLKICHSNGVMHRDLKLENIMYVNDKKSSPLKIIDFGLSIIFTPGQKFNNEPTGTLRYSAPEVIQKKYDSKSDIWSAGVILYALLYGTLPFDDDTTKGLKRAICKGKVNFKRKPWPNISSEAIDLLKNMLHLDPGSRPTAEGVLDHPWIKNA